MSDLLQIHKYYISHDSFVTGEEPRKVIFKDDTVGCDDEKDDCVQQRDKFGQVDSAGNGEPVTPNQGKVSCILAAAAA